MRRLVLPLTAIAVLTLGCGDGDPGASEDPTATVTVTAEPDIESTESDEPIVSSPEPTGPVEPNVGDSALYVGDTRQGASVSTTLFEVKYPFPQKIYRDPEPGNVFFGIRLQQCLTKDETEEIYSSYNGEFAAVTPDGIEFSGSGSSWDDWPSPKFPESVTMVPGRCIKGWIATEVPRGTKVDSVLWRPGGVTTAEWLLKR
jgi:hypothetical protein